MIIEHVPESRYLSVDALMATLGLKSRSTVYEWVRRGVFPRPVQLGAATSRWPSKEVAAVCAARVAGQDDDAIRLLVEQIHERRGGAQNSAPIATPHE